jgi:hypothetical protein
MGYNLKSGGIRKAKYVSKTQLNGHNFSTFGDKIFGRTL